MRPQKFVLQLASALLAAVVVTALVNIPILARIEEPWTIVVVSESLALARTTFIVVAAYALALGLPLFALMRSMRRVGFFSCALGGFLTGAVPFGILALVSMTGLHSAWSGGKPTVVNGVPTLAGWIEYAYAVGFAGALGLSGGLTFWIAMRLSGQITGRPNGPEAESGKLRANSWGVVSTAVLLTCAVFVLPRVAKDNSCHNLFRDGRTSVRAQVSAELQLSTEDWPTLRQIFVDFGTEHSLTFRGDEQVRDGNVTWRDLNLCNEAGVNIDALDRPGLRQILPLARTTYFSVYALKPNTDWESLARNILKEIDTRWPRKTTFRGPSGNVVSLEEALRGRQ